MLLILTFDAQVVSVLPTRTRIIVRSNGSTFETLQVQAVHSATTRTGALIFEGLKVIKK